MQETVKFWCRYCNYTSRHMLFICFTIAGYTTTWTYGKDKTYFCI